MLFFFGAPAILTAFVLLTCARLDPVQSFYFVPYLESAIEGDTRGGSVTVQYASKTAPGRQPAPLLPGDAVRNMAVKQRPKAISEGWQGIAISPPRRAYPPALESQLQASVYDGESAGWMVGQPVLILMAVLFILWLTVRLLRSSSKSNRAHEERHGRRTKGPELVRGLSRFRRAGKGGIRLRMQGRGMLPGGSYTKPKRLESSHILLMGDTGSGKSSAIRQILRQVHERGYSAIVYDPAMDFVGEFYSPERGD